MLPSLLSLHKSPLFGVGRARAAQSIGSAVAPARAAWTGAARAVPLWAVLACGPSFEVLQEGDLRFAHCERLDLDVDIALSHRLHCWREWRRVYTFAQTRDRAEYAQRRIAELVSGDSSPPFALPAGPHSGAVRQPLESGPRRRTPRAACQSHCAVAFALCSEGCEVRATGCDPCQLDHARCTKGCT